MKKCFSVKTNWTFRVLNCNFGLISTMLQPVDKNGYWHGEYRTNMLDFYGLEKYSSLWTKSHSRNFETHLLPEL